MNEKILLCTSIVHYDEKDPSMAECDWRCMYEGIRKAYEIHKF